MYNPQQINQVCTQTSNIAISRIGQVCLLTLSHPNMKMSLGKWYMEHIGNRLNGEHGKIPGTASNCHLVPVVLPGFYVQKVQQGYLISQEEQSAPFTARTLLGKWKSPIHIQTTFIHVLSF